MKIIKTQLTFDETLRFVDRVVDNVFIQDETGKDVDYSPASLYPLIQATFATYYTDMEFTEDFNKNYEEYMAIDINSTWSRGGTTGEQQFRSILDAINQSIDFRKQKLLDAQSKQGEMYTALTTLLSTLNTKASEIDVKNIDKYLKKLNVKEIIKEYQKSNIGNNTRDKAIQDLVKENKQLKNKESARNVVSD